MVRYDHIPRIMFTSIARRKTTPNYFSNRTKKTAVEERVAQRLKIRGDIVYELKKN